MQAETVTRSSREARAERWWWWCCCCPVVGTIRRCGCSESIHLQLSKLVAVDRTKAARMLVGRGERAAEVWPQRACAPALKITRRFPLPDLRGRQGRIPPHTPARRGRGARGAWRLSLANRAPNHCEEHSLQLQLQQQLSCIQIHRLEISLPARPRGCLCLSPSCCSSRVGLQEMRVLRWCSCSSDSTWKPLAPLASRPKWPSTPSSVSVAQTRSLLCLAVALAVAGPCPPFLAPHPKWRTPSSPPPPPPPPAQSHRGCCRFRFVQFASAARLQLHPVARIPFINASGRASLPSTCSFSIPPPAHPPVSRPAPLPLAQAVGIHPQGVASHTVSACPHPKPCRSLYRVRRAPGTSARAFRHRDWHHESCSRLPSASSNTR